MSYAGEGPGEVQRPGRKGDGGGTNKGMKLSKEEAENMRVDVILDSNSIGPNGSEGMVKRLGWEELGERYGGGRVDWEIVARFMPTDFARLYEALVHRALAVPGSMRGGRGYDENVKEGVGKKKDWALTSESPQLSLVAQGNFQGSGNKTVVLSEAAVAYRAKLDRKIRKLAREIKDWFADESGHSVIWRCTGQKCGRFAEETWRYCPWCGGDVDLVQKDSAKRTAKKRGQ